MNKSSPSAPTSSVLDHLCINTIRFLSIDAIQKANSGHPGMPMGAASMAYVLWTRFLRHNPGNPTWFNRDRFVLSAGHGSMLLYSLLFLTGYNQPLEQIKQFRQWGSKTPGHPERDPSCGIEVTTGPLGQGFAMAWEWQLPNNILQRVIIGPVLRSLLITRMPSSAMVT